MNIYIWSGDDIEALQGFYSRGLFIASGHTKEEAVEALRRKYLGRCEIERRQHIKWFSDELSREKNPQRISTFNKKINEYVNGSIEQLNINQSHEFAKKLRQYEPRICEVDELAEFQEQRD